MRSATSVEARYKRAYLSAIRAEGLPARDRRYGPFPTRADPEHLKSSHKSVARSSGWCPARDLVGIHCGVRREALRRLRDGPDLGGRNGFLRSRNGPTAADSTGCTLDRADKCSFRPSGFPPRCDSGRVQVEVGRARLPLRGPSGSTARQSRPVAGVDLATADSAIAPPDSRSRTSKNSSSRAPTRR